MKPVKMPYAIKLQDALSDFILRCTVMIPLKSDYIIKVSHNVENDGSNCMLE
jgi:hypothetical protein